MSPLLESAGVGARPRWLWLLPALLAWGAPSRAQQPIEAISNDQPVSTEADPTLEDEEVQGDSEPDEIIYVDDQAVIKARQEVGLALRDLGYQKKRSRNGREIYVNEAPWKPQVVVDDDGWMVVRRAPPTVGKPDLPGIWGGPLGYLVCVANPTACIHIGGWVVSGRKLAWQKEEVVRHLEPSMGRYEDALVGRAFNERTGEVIPDALVALWEGGVPIDGDEPLVTHEARRAALLELWASRNCNEWGEAVRQVVRDFMVYEVQSSEHPFLASEVALANLRRSCEEPLFLEGFDD